MRAETLLWFLAGAAVLVLLACVYLYLTGGEKDESDS